MRYNPVGPTARNSKSGMSLMAHITFPLSPYTAKLIISAALTMRDAQREYFKTRSQHWLSMSRKWEKKLDDLLAGVDVSVMSAWPTGASEPNPTPPEAITEAAIEWPDLVA